MIGDAGHGNYTLFEECLFKNGFAPVISIPTHERQNCKPSCINNILSGCITIRIGDHDPSPYLRTPGFNVAKQPNRD